MWQWHFSRFAQYFKIKIQVQDARLQPPNVTPIPFVLKFSSLLLAPSAFPFLCLPLCPLLVFLLFTAAEGNWAAV